MTKSSVRFQFNKLVRDRISTEMQDPRIIMKTRILDLPEFILELKKKLVEESDEVVASIEDDLIDELADLQEIIETLMNACDISKEAVQVARSKKRDQRGSFEKRIFVDYADVPRDSKVYDYCMQQPNKYPIITE